MALIPLTGVMRPQEQLAFNFFFAARTNERLAVQPKPHDHLALGRTAREPGFWTTIHRASEQTVRADVGIRHRRPSHVLHKPIGGVQHDEQAASFVDVSREEEECIDRAQHETQHKASSYLPDGFDSSRWPCLQPLTTRLASVNLKWNSSLRVSAASKSSITLAINRCASFPSLMLRPTGKRAITTCSMLSATPRPRYAQQSGARTHSKRKATSSAAKRFRVQLADVFGAALYLCTLEKVKISLRDKFFQDICELLQEPEDYRHWLEEVKHPNVNVPPARAESDFSKR